MGAAAVQSQRIRGPGIAVLVRRSEGVPANEGIQRADAQNHVVLSNKRWDGTLADSDEWRQPNARPALAAWTGTNAAYIEPDTTFERGAIVIPDLETVAGSRYFVAYTDPTSGKRWLFPVPAEHLGQQNTILVTEHPNYRLHVDGNDIITVPAGMSLQEAVDLVSNFSGADGWHLTDPVHGIPTGAVVNSSNRAARYLWRIARRVAPVARGWRFVDLYLRPSNGLVVAVEASAAGASSEFVVPAGSGNLTLTREGPSRLVIEGTPADVDAAVAALQQPKADRQ